MKQGNSALGEAAKKCEQMTAPVAAPAIPYTEARHRALCAIRCAANKRPFASQDDVWYQMEVELLRPGTITPSSKKRFRAIHIVVNRWTAPIDTSYLGCGVQWEQDGEPHFMVLEFIRLDERHTGEYLAQKLHECLEKYGLSKHLMILMMDGAGNCNTTATGVFPLNPRFKGSTWRGYCFLHIIQLSGKMILSFFTKQPTRKKRTVKVAASATQVEEVVLEGAAGTDQGDADLVQLLDEDAAEREAVQNQLPDGAARNEHDTAVVSKVRVAAISDMAARGVAVDTGESKHALQLIPRVCGLARKVHDSAPVANAFAKLVDQDTTIVGQTQTLARRCATRWNTEYDSLDTALVLEKPARKLLKNTDLNLTAYKLTDAQWDLAADLRDVLECVKEPTLMFSRGGQSRPLIAEVIPALESLRRAVNEAANSTEIANICRVAAYGGSLVLNKYIDLIPQCEAYEFAIVLSPTLKLDWFKVNGRSSTQIRRIRESIVARYDELFKTSATAQPAPPQPSAPTGRTRRRFGVTAEAAPSGPAQIRNGIESYLNSPPLTSLPAGKTVLQYWSAEKGTQPDLAEMALAYCSAPVTSVDGERAFSEGRNQCAWNQRSMSSQTFREQMSVGAWCEAPFFDLDLAEKMIEDHSRALRGPSI